MAAAQNGRDLLYFTFGDNQLRDEIYDVFTLLKNKNVNIGALYKVTFKYRNTVEPRYSDSFHQQAKSHYIEESHYFEVSIKWTKNHT